MHSTFGVLLQSDMRGSTSSVGWTTKAREREREIDVNNELLALIELEWHHLLYTVIDYHFLFFLLL